MGIRGDVSWFGFLDRDLVLGWRERDMLVYLYFGMHIYMNYHIRMLQLQVAEGTRVADYIQG